jgi:pimeloyl-ACP methyl ester carboxylesterase
MGFWRARGAGARFAGDRADEWQTQRSLAEEGFRLLVPDRRGYGRSPAAEREDFLRDADDIADLMGDGAHLVGHSYGGLGVLFAAARRLDATLSLTLLEPSAFALGQHHPAARTLVAECAASGIRISQTRTGSSAF